MIPTGFSPDPDPIKCKSCSATPLTSKFFSQKEIETIEFLALSFRDR